VSTLWRPCVTITYLLDGEFIHIIPTLFVFSTSGVGLNAGYEVEHAQLLESPM
jgi:hypothetical protein